ncbi:sensor histidine kinase [Microvirga sp. 2TAF3]|uniref:sensor histidine kinase n=1 Tax=Microvirga sp. 2TAF3 TaxID=3233014 RepID=UPI003F986595
MSPLTSWADGLSEIRFQAETQGFSHEALAGLLENMPLAIAVTVGPEHRFNFANRLFRTALSARTDNLVGRTIGEVLSDLYTPEMLALRTGLLETGKSYEAMEVPIAPAPGQEPAYWDLKLLPVHDATGKVIGILTLGANVTERVKAREEAVQKSRQAAIDSERLSLAVEATELGLWEWDAQTGQTYWSDRQKEIFGLSKERLGTYEYWVSALHPEDRDRVIACVSALLDPASGGQLRLEHRVVHANGDVRWILSRGRMLYELNDGTLKPARLLGTVLDITDRRESEETRRLLVSELNHRVKNLFAMASGMVALTARTAKTPKEMATSLRGRLEALARAHELIRPAIKEDAPQAGETSIGEITRAILAPHTDREDRSRLSIEGPHIPVGASAATGLTLVLHELATNASKYGALSVHDGQIAIDWTAKDTELLLTWREANGPAIACAPASEGFGSQLARKSIADQLGGEIAYDWLEEGLCVRIRLPLDRLSR